jgi:hypothetical protein
MPDKQLVKVEDFGNGEFYSIEMTEVELHELDLCFALEDGMIVSD